MKIEWLVEYEKDLKHYRKKFQTIDEDLADVQIILKKKPDQRPPFSYRIEGLGIETCVIKVKKIACRSLKGRGVNSGFRLVYAHYENEDRIVLVELYHKTDKEMEDRERIFKYFT